MARPKKLGNITEDVFHKRLCNQCLQYVKVILVDQVKIGNLFVYIITKIHYHMECTYDMSIHRRTYLFDNLKEYACKEMCIIMLDI